MDDLVKRLREENLRLKANLNEAHENMSHQLTEIFGLNDRIETLEAALRWMIDIKVDETNAEDCVKFMQEEARHALGEKKDA